MTAKRRRPSDFQRAAEGSMTLIEHIRELRTRLFKASVAIVITTVVAFFFAQRVQDFMTTQYCDFIMPRLPAGGYPSNPMACGRCAPT